MNYPQDEFDKIPEGTGNAGAHRGFGAPIAAGTVAGAASYSANLSADDPQYSDSYEYIYVDDAPSRKGLLPILIAGTAALVIGALAFFVVPQLFRNNTADPVPVASTSATSDESSSDPYTSTWTPSSEDPSSSASSSAEFSSPSSTYIPPRTRTYIPPTTYQAPRTTYVPPKTQAPRTSETPKTSVKPTPTPTPTPTPKPPKSSSTAPTSASATSTKATISKEPSVAPPSDNTKPGTGKKTDPSQSG